MEAMQTQGDVRTGVEMTLVCWTCGAKKTILVGKKPEFGIEFGHIVERAGWRAAEDRRVRRILAFCSDKCDEMAQTKTGLYRKYPPKKQTTLVNDKTPAHRERGELASSLVQLHAALVSTRRLFASWECKQIKPRLTKKSIVRRCVTLLHPVHTMFLTLPIRI